MEEESLTPPDIILGVLDDCREAFNSVSQPGEFHAQVDSSLSLWMSDVIQLSQEHPSLSPVNDILSFLAVSSAEEYAQGYKNQLVAVYNAVFACELLEPLLHGEFGDAMNSYIHDIQSDDETDGEGEMSD